MSSTLANAVVFNALLPGNGTFAFGSAVSSYLTLVQAVSLGEISNGNTVSYFAVNSVINPTQREWGTGTFSAAGGGSIARSSVLGTVDNGASGSGAPLNFATAPIVYLTALASDFASGGGSTGANPTATAGPTAVNGTATTFLRSDGAPAVQVATTGQEGLVKPDGTTITISAGTITAVQPTGANPSATAGAAAVNGSATTFLRSDGAPAIQKASATQFGIVEVDGTTITAVGGVITAAGGGGSTNSGPLFNVNLSGNNNLAQSWWLQAATDSFDVTAGFPDTVALEIDHNVLHGFDYTNSHNNNKLTSIALGLFPTYQGSGQRISLVKQINDFSTGDCFAESTIMSYAGCNTGSDEGKGFHAVGHLFQQGFPTSGATISSVGPRSSVNATTSGAISQSGNNAQTVSISGTAPVANDWVIVDQDNLAPGLSNAEAVKVISATGTSFTAIFRFNHASGVVVLPATVLVIDGVDNFGEDRWLVDISATPYATGTIGGFSGNTVTGAGTSWTAGIVGGDAHNTGVIYFNADVIQSVAFFGTGIGNQLTSYYPISSVSGSTTLNISLLYNFGNQNYRGFSGAGDTYAIYPAVKVMWIAPGATQGPLVGTQTVICSYFATAFTAGHTTELAFGPNPCITPFSYQVADYTPGSFLNPFFSVQNIGSNGFRGGFYIDGSSTTGGNTTNGFETGYMAVNVTAPFVCTNNPGDPSYNSFGFLAGTMVYTSQADGIDAVYQNFAGGGGAVRFTGHTFGGTFASPTGVPANALLISIDATGYDGSSFLSSTAVARLQAVTDPAGSTWTSSDHGSYWAFKGCNVGHTSQINQFYVNPWGGYTPGDGIVFSQLPSASAQATAFALITDSPVTSGIVTTGGGSNVVWAYSTFAGNWVVLANLTAGTGNLTTTPPSTTALNADYTVDSGGILDSVIVFTPTTSRTLTLPSASTYTGRWLYIKSTGGGGTIISASSNVRPQTSQTAGTAILAATTGAWAALQSDGTDWGIIMSGT